MRVRKGNPVSGSDFWPRPEIVDELYRALVEDRGSRSMFGLRRIGKTSILLELERRLTADGLITIRVDVQGVARVRDFLSKVLGQIPNEDRFGEARRRIAANPFFRSLLPALVARLAGTANPQNAPSTDFVNELNHHSAWEGDVEAALREAGGIVLMIDELPFMLRDMLRSGYQASDVERFLAMLRSWRFNCGVRILLTGSLGLSQLQRGSGLQFRDHVGDLFPVSVPPLSSTDAVALIDALANGEGVADWTSELSAAVVDASAETWPIFLQFGFDAVWRSGLRDPNRVKEIIDGQVRQALDETFYAQFSTRLGRYGDDEKVGRIILKTAVASWPEPASFDAIDTALSASGAVDRRDDVLEALREDDLLRFDTESRTVQPASRLVVIWVRARAWGR